MAQEFFCMLPENTFEVRVVNDENSIHHGQCPIPPALNHQMDSLMIQIKIKWQDKILHRMKKMILDRSRKSWFEIFLTIFVMLTNLEYVYQSQVRWWKMHFQTVSLQVGHFTNEV